MKANQRINYTRKSRVSIKMFITEFGEEFPEHVKKRLMELESRCYLARKEVVYRFDLRHVEHLKYDCSCEGSSSLVPCSKEYAYGQFVVLEGILYFSDSCVENNEIIQSPTIDTIFNGLGCENIISDDGRNLKKLDDDNIDYVIDSILASCPQVSQSYMDIVNGMVSRANNR